MLFGVSGLLLLLLLLNPKEVTGFALLSRPQPCQKTCIDLLTSFDVGYFLPCGGGWSAGAEFRAVFYFILQVFLCFLCSLLGA